MRAVRLAITRATLYGSVVSTLVVVWLGPDPDACEALAVDVAVVGVGKIALGWEPCSFKYVCQGSFCVRGLLYH